MKILKTHRLNLARRLACFEIVFPTFSKNFRPQIINKKKLNTARFKVEMIVLIRFGANNRLRERRKIIDPDLCCLSFIPDII